MGHTEREDESTALEAPLGSKTNWAAVSALAAVGGVLVAFIAYAEPHAVQVLQPVPTPAPTTAPVQPLEPVTTTPAFTPVQVPTATPGPPLSVTPLQPPGCAQALPVVDTYYQTAGTTKYTQKAAARQAAQDLFDIGSRLTGGPAFSDITALYRDFSSMVFALEDMSSLDYSAVQAQTMADAQTLRRVCGTS